MRIFLCCSKRFYDQVADIKEELEKAGHTVTPPNGYNDPDSENLIKKLDHASYVGWKADMIRKNSGLVKSNEAVLLLNLGTDHYVGGAAFLEAFKAFEEGKKLFLYNPIPDSILKDELVGMSPVILNGNLKKLV